MNSEQLRKVAEVAQKYGSGYAHISTRQNIQLNWSQLEDVSDILQELATVHMHSIQTSVTVFETLPQTNMQGYVKSL